MLELLLWILKGQKGRNIDNDYIDTIMENVKQKNFQNFEIFIEINFGLLKQFYLILSGRNFCKKNVS